MEKNNQETKTWKQKLIHEFTEYWINVIYLTVFFGLYAVSRRLLLANYNIFLDDYFIGLIKALVLGKVIMIGAIFKIGRKVEDMPLFIPIFYKTVMFTLWIALFNITEALVRSLYHNFNFTSAFNELINVHFTNLWLSEAIIVFLAFMPFFALKELSRVIGTEKFRQLFYRKRVE